LWDLLARQAVEEVATAAKDRPAVWPAKLDDDYCDGEAAYGPVFSDCVGELGLASVRQATRFAGRGDFGLTLGWRC
jgi:hypothetical protein